MNQKMDGLEFIGKVMLKKPKVEIRKNQTIGVYSWDGGTLNKEEGNGLRYEWFLENGKVIGTSKSYHPNGILKETREWGNGIKNGWKDGIMIIHRL